MSVVADYFAFIEDDDLIGRLNSADTLGDNEDDGIFSNRSESFS